MRQLSKATSSLPLARAPFFTPHEICPLPLYMVLNHINKQNQLMKVAENKVRDNSFNSNREMLDCLQSTFQTQNKCFTEKLTPNSPKHLLLPISSLH